MLDKVSEIVTHGIPSEILSRWLKLNQTIRFETQTKIEVWCAEQRILILRNAT